MGGGVDPQNPNPCGAHNTDGQQSPRGEIIQSFNEKLFRS